jgi:hypothetical protein
MAYYGQIPFNTNGGALLSKRNYINRKLDEIEQKLLQLGWIEPEQEQETETFNEEYDIPVESAGALIPYRDKVNKRLDFYEEVIQSHVGYDNYNDSYDNSYNDYNNSYNDYNNNSYNNNSYTPSTYNNNYNNSYTPSTKPSMYNNYPRQQNIDTTQTKTQEEVSKSFNSAFSDIFG